jgi:ribosomal RNA-processing protein 9
MAISSDSQYLATGGKDKSIKIWNANTSEFVYSFEGHRDAVSGVVFQQNTHQLYSASFDRSVKVWDVDQLVYIETLFGHQDKIMGIDTLSKERCITCGARDRTIRMWKIIEESQLLFNGAN